MASALSQLRAAGRSRREIQAELHIGDDLAKALLRGVPLPDRLARPRAKDEQREDAVALRLAGKTYDQIAAELRVSKSSCSLWLRDLPHPVNGELTSTPVEQDTPADERREQARRLRTDGFLLRQIGEALGISAKTAYYLTWDLPVPAEARSGGDKAHVNMMRRRYWDRVLAERADERTQIKAEHLDRVGRLSMRELELLAVAAYWCEGCKSKTYDRREQVTFINSDPGLILLFLAWLDQLGFPKGDRRLSLSIHESADVEAATRWLGRRRGCAGRALRRRNLEAAQSQDGPQKC